MVLREMLLPNQVGQLDRSASEPPLSPNAPFPSFPKDIDACLQCNIMCAKSQRTNPNPDPALRNSSSQHAHEHVAHEANDDPPHEQAHGDIEHLHAVSSARAAHKVTAVIDVGELLALGHTLAEEVAQRLPALLYAELQQTLGVLAVVGGQLDHIGVVAAVDVLAGGGEGALEEGVEEHLQHGVVHLSSPGARQAKGKDLVAERGELRVRGAPEYRGHRGLVPAVDLAAGQDHLGFRVHLNQLLGEGAGRPVAHSLAVAKQLVPELAGSDGVGRQGRALGEVLGDEGVVPQQSVWRVLDRSAHHVICLNVAEVLHCRTHSFSLVSELYCLSFLRA